MVSSYHLKNGRFILKILKDPLLLNSLYIMASGILNSAIGFLFWIIAARLYETSQVGVAAAMISSIGLIVLVTRLGLDYSMIRYSPERDRSAVFISATAVSTVLALVLAVVFVAGTDIWSPNLIVLKDNLLVYVVIVGGSSIFSMTGIAFLAMRQSRCYLVQNLIMTSRIAFLFFLVSLGAIGIIGSLGLSYVAAITVSVVLLVKFGLRLKSIDVSFLKEAFHFSAGNYIGVMLMTAPNLILPLIVLETLGAENAAYYFIAYSVAALLFIVPTAVATSLFVEGSHDKELKPAAGKAIRFSVLLLLLFVPAVFLLGQPILAFVGEGYVEALGLLRILALSSFFVVLCHVYIAVKRVQKNARAIMLFSALIFVIFMSLSIPLLQTIGLAGVGYAWIAAYASAGCLAMYDARREKWNS